MVVLILRLISQVIGVEQKLSIIGPSREGIEEGQTVGPFDVALVLVPHHILDSGGGLGGVGEEEHVCLIFGLWEADSW